MAIGVLALQGAFVEHRAALERLGVEVVEVRLPHQLEGLSGLILPGGESTAIGKLIVAYRLLEPLQAFARTHPVWGTCAGAILLAKDIGSEPPWLGVMDIAVERNAFGRQVESFEEALEVPALCTVDPVSRPFRAVFIRAPRICRVGAGGAGAGSPARRAGGGRPAGPPAGHRLPPRAERRRPLPPVFLGAD